jgi:hypothetical protein
MLSRRLRRREGGETRPRKHGTPLRRDGQEARSYPFLDQTETLPPFGSTSLRLPFPLNQQLRLARQGWFSDVSAFFF